MTGREPIGRKQAEKKPASARGKPSSPELDGRDEKAYSIGQTPYQAPVDRHRELLAGASSDVERAALVMRLQQTYGNAYVQSLVSSMPDRLTSPAGSLNGTITKGAGNRIPRDEPIDEEQASIARDEPLEEEETDTGSPTEEREKEKRARGTGVAITAPLDSPVLARQRQTAKAAALRPENPGLKGRPPPVLVPVNPDRAAGTVIVKDKAFAVWVNPKASACIVGGIRVHEEKHISDFQADADYKDIPTSGTVPDGETFYYKNDADAKRFEHPAIDVEMAWLREQLKGNPPEEDKKRMERRLNITLPKYRESFG